MAKKTTRKYSALVDIYVKLIRKGARTINDVPKKWRDRVRGVLNGTYENK